MNKIRLLHIAQCAGGVDCYLRMLLAHMDKKCFMQILICSPDYSEDKYQDLVEEFIQIEMCNSLSFVKDTKAIRKVRELIKHFRPDVIYCHSSKAGGIGRIANMGIGIPIIYNPHGWAFNMKGAKLKSFVYLWIERLLSSLTTRYITISNYETLSAIQNHVTKANKVKVIFNGIDMEAVDKEVELSIVSRVSLNIPENAYLIGMVGRISRQKAPDVFIHVAAALKNILPDAYFMIVGDGPDREMIEEYARENNIALFISGWVENASDYISLFDVDLLLSRWEGFGLAIPEYMLAGKPVVVSRVDAIPEIVKDTENGLLVKPDDIDGTSNAVLELYKEGALQMKLRNKGMITVHEKFDVKRTAKESEMLLNSVINGGGGQYELIAVILPEVLCVSCRVRQTCYAAAEMAVA